MTRFKFGNLKQKGLYIDETTMRMCYTHRRLLAQTALQLIAEGKKQKAINILKKADTRDSCLQRYARLHEWWLGYGSRLADGRSESQG